jgi:hypothetical protein
LSMWSRGYKTRTAQLRKIQDPGSGETGRDRLSGFF